MGAREPFRAKVRDRTESVASLSVIAATRPGTRPVVITTGSFVVAMSCGLADGRQEPRHVALKASDLRGVTDIENPHIGQYDKFQRWYCLLAIS